MRLEDFDNDEDKIIQDKLKQKTWNEIRTNDSWAIFKIMAEFVNGYESMGRIGPCVSIFGSARTQPEDPFYLLAEKIAFKISKAGYGVITGGGPGIMEASNKGAHFGGGTGNCNNEARRRRSGAIDGRPPSAYRESKVGDIERSTKSASTFTRRSGCSVGMRSSILT